MSSAVILLSSGLDSTVNLYRAQKEMTVSLVLTFDYGQRAAKRELAQSQKITALLGLRHQVVELPWLRDITSTALVNTDASVPQGAEVQIDNYDQSLHTAKSVWVPNRNGVFLNVAASFAESLQAKYVIPGFNKEEATTFPDNTVEYLQALDHSFSFSTASQVRTMCYTSKMDKTEIAQLGRELRVPFELMWPCYFGEPKMCGQCESCLRFKRATGL
jgi:7-cyano-7-deazaguanine synthase